MVLKGLGIRKCVSSGLASCMCTILCIAIDFCCLLFMCCPCIACGTAPVSEPECNALHIS